MRKIRVLQAIRQGMVGGGETHVYDLATSINRDKFEPIVLSFTEGAMVDKLNDQNVDTNIIFTTIPFDFRVSKKIEQLLIEKKIDLVHAHGTRAASNVLHPARNLNIPVIYTVHGWSFNDNQNRIVKYLRVATESYITRKVNKTICVSLSNLQTGQNHIKGFQGNVINNGISFEKFSYQADNKQVESLFTRQPEQIWIGFIARMTFQKNPLGLLKAFQLAYRVNKNLRLLMVGEGELTNNVKDTIQEYGLTEIVTLLPFQDNIPQLLAAIDIYCLPSRWEGLSIGLLEAMAMHKAIIATNVDGTKELINNNVNGALVEKDDIESLSETIIELASNATKMKVFGENAYKTVNENFSLKGMVHQTENVYETILAKG
uniref:Glycosyltransferase family 4 protein n=1 Tax=Roseihalotalea indica TaxID=2867963 RepID=A0AA49GIT5_9BACT|nr:glycosyltransferase family 4 protein [Tunicatimonas sp. TK19036]